MSNKTKLTLSLVLEKVFFLLTYALGTAAVVAFLMFAAGEADNLTFFKEVLIRLGYLALTPVLGWLAIMTWCAKLYAEDLYKVYLRKAYVEMRKQKK